MKKRRNKLFLIFVLLIVIVFNCSFLSAQKNNEDEKSFLKTIADLFSFKWLFAEKSSLAQAPAECITNKDCNNYTDFCNNGRLMRAYWTSCNKGVCYKNIPGGEPQVVLEDCLLIGRSCCDNLEKPVCLSDCSCNPEDISITCAGRSCGAAINNCNEEINCGTCLSGSCNLSTGKCEDGCPLNCNDNNKCTDDSCNENPFECKNTPKDCNDENSCTADSCDPFSGDCENIPVPGVGCCEGKKCANPKECEKDPEHPCIRYECNSESKLVPVAELDGTACTTRKSEGSMPGLCKSGVCIPYFHLECDNYQCLKKPNTEKNEQNKDGCVNENEACEYLVCNTETMKCEKSSASGGRYKTRCNREKKQGDDCRLCSPEKESLQKCSNGLCCDPSQGKSSGVLFCLNEEMALRLCGACQIGPLVGVASCDN